MLCYFHREKAWNEWIIKGTHNVKNQEDLKKMLRQIAESESERKYEIALKQMKDSKEWTENIQLQNWFNTTWMPEVEVKI